MPKEPKTKRGKILGARYYDNGYGGNDMEAYINAITEPGYPFPLAEFEIQEALEYIRWCEQDGDFIPENWRLFQRQHRRNRGFTFGELIQEIQQEREAKGRESSGKEADASVIQRSPEKKEEERHDSTSVEMILRHFKRGPNDIEDYLPILANRELFEIPLTTREEMISKMSNNFWVGEKSETGIIRLLETVPDPQAKSIVDWLQSEKGALLKRLENSIQGENYRIYHRAIRRLYFQSMHPEEAYKKMLRAQKFPWSDPGFIHYAKGAKKFKYEVDYAESGMLHITIYPEAVYMPIALPLEFMLHPFDMGMINMNTGDAELGMSEGQNVFAPALTLFVLQNQQSTLKSIDLLLI